MLPFVINLPCVHYVHNLHKLVEVMICLYFWCRQYNRLVKNLKPDMENYGKQKEKLGNAFYADNHTIIHGLHKDSPEAIQKLAEDVEKQLVLFPLAAFCHHLKETHPFFSHSGLPREINSVEDERLTQMQTLTISMSAICASTKRLSDSMDNILQRSSRIWSVELLCERRF